MNTTMVTAIFESKSSLERSLVALKANGFSDAEISMILPSDSPASNDPSAVGNGMLVGSGSLPSAGIGSLIASGPVMATVAETAIALPISALYKGLNQLGLPSDHCHRYEALIKNGNMLVSVHLQKNANDPQSIVKLLESCGGKEITTL